MKFEVAELPRVRDYPKSCDFGYILANSATQNWKSRHYELFSEDIKLRSRHCTTNKIRLAHQHADIFILHWKIDPIVANPFRFVKR